MFKYIKILIFTMLISTSMFGKVKTTHILLINSYHQGMAWSDNITNAVIKKFVFPNSPFSLHIEYMDTKRIHNEKYLENLSKIYIQKYKNTNLKLILSLDNNALDFLKIYRNDIFGNIPVIFSGINDFHESMLDGHEQYTGIEEKASVIGTVKAIVKIHPKLKKIYILNDYLKTGKAWNKAIKDDLSSIDLNLEYIYFPAMSIDELENKISSLPNDSAVLLGSYFSDKNGVQVSHETLKSKILINSSVPIYTLAEYYIGDSIIGGKVISGNYQGIKMSDITFQVLAGVSTEALPVISKDSNQFIFDSRILKKYNITEDKLPNGSLVINKNKTFYENYYFLVNLISSFIAILFLVIIILMINIRRRRISEKLLENQLSFEQVLIDSINIPIFYKNEKRLFLGCNSSFTKIFGIDKESIKGMNVFDIYPIDMAKIHDEVDSKLFKDNGSHKYITQIKTKDGQIKDVVMQKNTFNDNQGNTAGIIGSYFDITEITKAKKELEELNNNLEILVLNRTSDLEKANKKLQNTLINLENTHNTLLSSAKMASLGKLVASLTHEVNTPIGLGVTGISHFESETKNIEKMYTENNLGKEEFEEYLQNSRQVAKVILSNMTKASQIIKSFKNIAVDQTSELKREFNCKDYVNDIIFSLHNSIKKTKHTININCDSNLSINSYPGLISQIFTNFIMNSIIHGFEHKEAGIIDIDMLVDDKNNCHIFYTDNGQGMDDKALKKICDPFYTTKMNQGGSGLGMSIVNDIVRQQLKGTLNIDSQKNSYTKFEIIFPLDNKI